ncbi:hypothetical protein L6164_033139 [Bauhinia variegata]|uniref:Uncharacterized protein n=1 Tax=Bauhinia variegata TaxID=167791 RepID=A0ACB9KR25_BAUVA|nr:hypothetical protein L6164_033139 [Bauhinia variegata]
MLSFLVGASCSQNCRHSYWAHFSTVKTYNDAVRVGRRSSSQQNNSVVLGKILPIPLTFCVLLEMKYACVLRNMCECMNLLYCGYCEIVKVNVLSKGIMDDYFTLCIHHGDRFIPGPPRKYKGGWVDHVDYVDPDRFSLTVIAGLLKVGYAWWNRVIMYYLGKTRIMDSDDDIVLGGGVEYFTDSSSEEYDSADDEAYKIDPHEMEYDSEDENNDGSIGNDFVKREKYKNKRTGQAIEGMDEGHIGNGGIDEGMCKGPIKTSKDAAYDLMHKSQGLNSQ